MFERWEPSESELVTAWVFLIPVLVGYEIHVILVKKADGSLSLLGRLT